MRPSHYHHMSGTSFGHHFRFQVSAVHRLQVSDDRRVRKRGSQCADAVQAFRQDQRSTRFQPVNAGSNGEVSCFESFVDISEVERYLNNGAHRDVIRRRGVACLWSFQKRRTSRCCRRTGRTGIKQTQQRPACPKVYILAFSSGETIM